MNLFDMKTVIISYIISNAICVLVVTMLWVQNRKRFDGIGFWLADFVMQFIALILVALRGLIPDLISMTVSNALVVGGTMLLLTGLERFLGKRRPQIHNAILMVIFVLAHAYFVVVSPSLNARNIIFSLGLLVICFQCAWLILHRVDVEMRDFIRNTGILFLAYCLVSITRIFVDVAIPSDNNLFHSNVYDTLAVMVYQMLFIGLTFSLFLMANRRLVVDLELDITVRKRTENALRLSDEKFQKAFHSSPDAILITRVSDGQIVEVNEGFSHIAGYSREEALGNSTITLEFWANPKDRESFVSALREQSKVRGFEYNFRSKSGGILNCLISADIILLDNVPHVLSVIQDVSERKQADEALKESEERYRMLFETMAQGVVYQAADGYITSANPAAEKILGLTLDQMQGRTSIDPHWRAIHEDGSPFPGETHPSMLALQTGMPVPNAVMGIFNPQLDEYRWINVNAVPQFRSGEVVPYQVYSTFDDITERRLADEVFQIRLKLFELSSSCSLADLMQKALDEVSRIANSPIGFYHFVEADQKTLSLQAWSTRTLAEFCNAEGSGLHYPIDQAGVWTDCIVKREPVIHNDYPSLPHRKGLPPGHADVIRELVVPILRDGHVVSILGVGNKPSNYDEKDAQFVSYLADVIWEIVEHKRAEDKLQQLSRAVEQSPASIVITDTEGKIEYVNPRFTEVTGYDAGEAIGKNPNILKTDKTPRETYRQLWQALTSGMEWHGEFINRKKNGEEYYEYSSISPVMNEQGIATHYLAVNEDITGRKMAEKELRNKNQVLQFQLETIKLLEAELREQAIRDPLTGLYNRRYLYETMGRELARAQREKYPISFMMMDIDLFKQVNDTYGHAAGDKVLVVLADLLRTHTRLGDIACRYGGEEFLVIMLHVCETDAKRRAEEICHNLYSMQIDYSGAQLSVTISIGVAFYPRHGDDSDMVIKTADAALYKAKQAGRNCVRVWEAEPQSENS